MDFSAASGSGSSPAANQYVSAATQEAWQPLLRSGHYEIVATEGANLICARAVDIRSNSDESWLRAMTFILKNYLLTAKQM